MARVHAPLREVEMVLLTLLPEMTRSAAEYRYIIYGLVLLLVVIYRPQGVLSLARGK